MNEIVIARARASCKACVALERALVLTIVKACYILSCPVPKKVTSLF